MIPFCNANLMTPATFLAPIRRVLIERFFTRGLQMSALLADERALADFIRANVFGVWHASGTCRMGDARETNVVDRFGFSHEVPNLGIVGASVMGTSGAHNPTLTAQALAWRTADHLAANWNAIAKG